MKRFILQQNLLHFAKIAASGADEATLRTIAQLVGATRRELSLLDAACYGASAVQPTPRPARLDVDTGGLSRFREIFETSRNPFLLIDPRPGLRIVEANAAYGHATMTLPHRIAGEALFDVFPDNPADEAADGVSNLFGSLCIAARTGRPQAMAIQRYDVRAPSGHFVERYWQPVNTPILDESDNLVFILHHVEDVTAKVQGETSFPRQALPARTYHSKPCPRACPSGTAVVLEGIGVT